MLGDTSIMRGTKPCHVASMKDQDCIKANEIQSLLLLPGIMKPGDRIVTCRGKECSKDSALQFKITKEVEVPTAYCVDDFDNVYTDEYVVAVRGDPDLDVLDVKNLG